jgi:hypothetical protein
MAKYVIAYDVERMQPGCVLLQALMGGTVPSFSALFDPSTWLLAPTPAMRPYEVDEAQLERLASLSKTRSRCEP